MVLIYQQIYQFMIIYPLLYLILVTQIILYYFKAQILILILK